MLPARNGGNSWETAADNAEEGGDDVKSSCPLCPGLHTYYNGMNRGKRDREVERTPEIISQFGLQAATRLHEVGIASNRRSAYPPCAGVNAISTPPGEYGRKVETQRN